MTSATGVRNAARTLRPLQPCLCRCHRRHLTTLDSSLPSPGGRKWPDFVDETPFPYDTLDVNWFPGHMRKALRELDERAKRADVVLEIRDARAPVSSGNAELLPLLTNKSHIIVLNKVDLVSSNHKKKLSRYFQRLTQHSPQTMVQFTNGAVVSSVRELLDNLCQHVRPRFRTVPSVVLVVGYPNVGKSTIINSLRNFADKTVSTSRRGAAKTGPLAGVTRHVSGFVVNSTPSLFLIDSPGIFMPKRRQVPEVGMNLALLAALPSHVIDSVALAQFLLYQLNRNRQFHYTTVFKFPAPIPHTNIYEALTRIANVYRDGMAPHSVSIDDHSARTAAEKMLSLFRRGALGRTMLDHDIMDAKLSSSVVS